MIKMATNMVKFAFYGRVSTEDQQDPQASRNWQYSRAEALVSGHGSIVREFFDIGESRSIPWKRRPRASELLELVGRPDRGFDAVVIGEPQRAFYGNQYGLTFPVFEHYRVGLWVPKVGGPIDPESEAHDLVMSVFGGMSKGERNRIKIRVRTAMAAQARIEGRYLGGRPPYGYRLVDAGPHPNPAKAADGRRLHRLEPDPIAAVVVQRIFGEYLSGRGIYAIAEGLTREGISSPSARDAARNPHRCGVAWAKSAVRAILLNPRYTGRQVWNKQRKDDVLIDVDDVALGHVTKLRWNNSDDWVWSTSIAHEPLIDTDTFERAQQIMAAGGRGRARERTQTQHPYVLRGLLHCALCGRRMQGQRNHGGRYYRCRFAQEYALANNVDHPRNVYLAEDDVLPPLDDWLAQAFSPDRLTDTITAMHQAQPHEDNHSVATEASEIIADCDRKLNRYRLALEAGTDPTLIAHWTAEVHARRLEALTRQSSQPGTRRMSHDEIAALVDALGSIRTVLATADPADKAEVYRQLDLRLMYQPSRRSVRTEVSLNSPAVGLRLVSEERCAHYSPGSSICSLGGTGDAGQAPGSGVMQGHARASPRDRWLDCRSMMPGGRRCPLGSSRRRSAVGPAHSRGTGSRFAG